MEDRTCGTTSGKPPPKSLGPEVIEHKKRRKKTRVGDRTRGKANRIKVTD